MCVNLFLLNGSKNVLTMGGLYQAYEIAEMIFPRTEYIHNNVSRTLTTEKLHVLDGILLMAGRNRHRKVNFNEI